MNRYKLIYFTLLLLTFSACKKDPPSATDERLTVLKNNNTAWGLTGGSVTKDGYDVTSQFSGFTITFGDYTYTTTNSIASAWAASGTWEFNNNNPDQLLRDDNVVVNISITASQLVMIFNVTGVSTGGKVEGVDGEYTFTLTSN